MSPRRPDLARPAGAPTPSEPPSTAPLPVLDGWPLPDQPAASGRHREPVVGDLLTHECPAAFDGLPAPRASLDPTLRASSDGGGWPSFDAATRSAPDTRHHAAPEAGHRASSGTGHRAASDTRHHAAPDAGHRASSGTGRRATPDAGHRAASEAGHRASSGTAGWAPSDTAPADQLDTWRPAAGKVSVAGAGGADTGHRMPEPAITPPPVTDTGATAWMPSPRVSSSNPALPAVEPPPFDRPPYTAGRPGDPDAGPSAPFYADADADPDETQVAAPLLRQPGRRGTRRTGNTDVSTAVSSTGRHAAVRLSRRRPIRLAGTSLRRPPITARIAPSVPGGWRRIGFAALAVLLVVLLGYGAVLALHPTAGPGSDQLAPLPPPPPDAAPAPAPNPRSLRDMTDAPSAPANPAAPQTAPQASAPAPRHGTAPSSMLVSGTGHAANCSSSCAETITLPGGAKMTVFDNQPLSGSSTVTRAVVVVHGTGRNAEGYFTRVLSAAKKDGASGHTMVVAPWFGDGKKGGSGTASWENDAWKQGYPAQNDGGLSSFTAMDDVIATLADQRRFPNLTHITVAGHSAGGQFTQRYAAFGKAPNLLPWVSFNFAVMNPSSFVYFDAARPNSSGSSFAVPSSSSCQDYNDYKYGLDGRQSYPGQLSAAAARAQYASRRVTILNGGADTFDNGDLDTNCGAMLQGPNRNARGQYFFQHLKALNPSAPHNRIVVPGVDHDSEAMVGSPLAAATLFGTN